MNSVFAFLLALRWQYGFYRGDSPMISSNGYPLCIRIALGAHLTRSISDDAWKIIDAANIRAWETAKTLFGRRTFKISGDSIDLSVDWSPVVRRLRRHFKVMERIEVSTSSAEINRSLSGFSNSPVIVSFNFETNIDGDQPRINQCIHISEYFLYEIFIAMNIASPSSIDFYSAKILSENYAYRENLNLTNNLFEIAVTDSVSGRWPLIDFLDVKRVFDWYRNIRSEMKMLPENRMEKVIFSMFHLAKSSVSPMNVVWLFYALESLFDCKVGENFRVLCSRIELLLQPNEKESKFFRRKLRDLYDLRSSFVHGGLEIIHPLGNEMIDNNITGTYHRLMEATEFGFQVLLASVQKTIKEGWSAPQFKEILDDGKEF
ncbi:hypothetical protein GYN07_13020 [Rhizobium leguminosarum bv. viciae 248]|uniref:HEPN domain-containing protein n=1 Tax=Rhizobium leguminosarum TaxID=384 RepID=UPI0003A45A5B|nr:HEPN domain-containing protein [Rhizobium leguminosarum]QHW25203.1 hypothetical protein GYN07_13020 [Rhizobium leguminosarum bv. viciae 248]